MAYPLNIYSAGCAEYELDPFCELIDAKSCEPRRLQHFAEQLHEQYQRCGGVPTLKTVCGRAWDQYGDDVEAQLRVSSMHVSRHSNHYIVNIAHEGIGAVGELVIESNPIEMPIRLPHYMQPDTCGDRELSEPGGLQNRVDACIFSDDYDVITGTMAVLSSALNDAYTLLPYGAAHEGMFFYAIERTHDLKIHGRKTHSIVADLRRKRPLQLGIGGC